MLADTTLLIDLLKGNKDAVDLIENADELFTTEINVYELLVSANLVKSEKIRQITEVLSFISSWHVLPLEREGTLKAAEFSARLRLKGQKIDETDCLIAGIALSFDVDMIGTANINHFLRIKELKVIGY